MSARWAVLVGAAALVVLNACAEESQVEDHPDATTESNALLPSHPRNLRDSGVARVVDDATHDASFRNMTPEMLPDATQPGEPALTAQDSGTTRSEDAGAPDPEFEGMVDAQAPASCDANAGGCAVCEPGTSECAGEQTQRICSDDGLSAFDRDCAEATPYCVGSGSCVECRDPGDCPLAEDCYESTCNEGQCQTQPSSAGTSCGTNGVCDGEGRCGACVPGERRCKDESLELCDETGDWQLEEMCPFVCRDTQCSGECVPGDAECQQSTARRCDSDGMWAPEQCTGATPECFAGQCVLPTPPSCASLDNQCGFDVADRCCASDRVNGGTFLRSYDGQKFSNSSYTATVDDFWIDRYEVSVARFRAFLDAGGGIQANAPTEGQGAHPAIEGSGWSGDYTNELFQTRAELEQELNCDAQLATWTAEPAGNEQRPINCLTWYEAFAFCVWDGGRLPTETEWNYAAAGGPEQRVFPWSNPSSSRKVSPDHASYWIDTTLECFGNGVEGCTLEDLVPVGSKAMGRGRYGSFDLGGNVWEWTLDSYKNPYAIAPCTNCADLSKSSSRVIRGGSFFGNVETLKAAARAPGTATNRFFTVGLRCAR